MNRVLRIAQEYGERLSERLGTKTIDGKRLSAIRQLTSGYPDHGFVIDREEASTWLENVRDCNDVDTELAMHLFRAVRRPIDVIELLYPILHTIQNSLDNAEGDTKSANSSGLTKGAIPENVGTKEDIAPNSSADYQAASGKSNQPS